MDHREIDEQDLVDRYVQGRLAGEEETAFEAHLLECGECFEKVRWADDMGRALKVAAAEDVARLTVGAGLAALTARLGRGGQLALVTLLLLAVVAPAMILRRTSGDAPRGNTPVFFLGAERSGDAAEPSQQIRPSAELGGVVLALELDAPASAGPFGASLRALDSPDDVRWRGEGLLLDHNATLTLSFPAGFFTPGDYELRVTPRTAPDESAPLSRFLFRVLPEDP